MRDLLLALVAVLAFAFINQTVATISFILWWLYACYILSDDNTPKKQPPFKPDKKYFIIENTETNTKEKVEI